MISRTHLNPLALMLGCFFWFFSVHALAAGSGDGYGSGDDEFAEVNKLIRAEKYREARAELLKLEVAKREADRFNLLGFTARKVGDYAEAGKYYEEALALDPQHVGALEYQGELFITLGQIDKAKQNLAKIEEACWLYCSEEGQLRDAIEAATAQ